MKSYTYRVLWSEMPCRSCPLVGVTTACGPDLQFSHASLHVKRVTSVYCQKLRDSWLTTHLYRLRMDLLKSRNIRTTIFNMFKFVDYTIAASTREAWWWASSGTLRNIECRSWKLASGLFRYAGAVGHSCVLPMCPETKSCGTIQRTHLANARRTHNVHVTLNP